MTPPSLALDRLCLSHFRSHRSLDLALDGRPVAIFGPNGAGKTNLVEAVSLLSPGRGLRRAAAEDMARRPEAIGWKITAGLTAPDGRHEIEIRSEGPGRLVEIDGKSAPQAALGHVARLLWLTPAMDRLWMESAAERRRFLDRIALSLMPDHGDAAIGYEKALRERNRLLRDGVRDQAWYEAIEAQMAASGARLGANRRAALARIAAAPAPGAFPAASLALESDAPEAEADLADAFRAGRPRDMAAGRSLLGPHRDDLGATYAAKGVPARLCSTGEQKALLISLVLANAHAVAEDFGAPPLLILDEVAAHLDAGRRAALYDAVTALGAQAWLTGTGRELFEELAGRALFLAVTETGGISAVSRE
ncbi:DNA replication/repair protein RecF [Rhodobacteraceae bacterium DSL-40]|uniref:DNA replication/repair protein RecF n=1 Tax=Amaricoccus sp. B4 TaxID=3368557 RepID=UPI000DAE6157